MDEDTKYLIYIIIGFVILSLILGNTLNGFWS
jgi:hypothetical protein